MTTHGIDRFLKARPFQAFTLRESSGETHRVISPETIMVLPKLNLVVVHTPDGSLVMLGADQITAAFYPGSAATKKKPKAE